MHTPAHGPTPTPTGPAPHTEPDTMQTNQTNQLNPPPPPTPSLSYTNSSGSGSGVNTITGTWNHPYSRPTTPGPLAHKHHSPARFFSLHRHQTHAGGKSRPHPTHKTVALAATGHSGRGGSALTRCARLSRPRSAKPGCSATT